MKKKSLALILVFILALALSGCSGSGDSESQGSGTGTGTGSGTGSETNNSTETTAEIDYSNHETFTYWLYSTVTDYYSDYSENPIVQFLNRNFNVTIQFEQPAAGNEQNALSLMFGTGEYTDAIDMSYYSGSITELYEDGVIIDITQYLDYMPNYKAILETNEIFRRSSYDDEGRILTLKPIFSEDELHWGGLVYRYDILETMTGGNVEFPSGNDEPTTLDDWEYMLSLMKMYFDATGMPETAPLIIPFNGQFPFGELASGFGVHTLYYNDNGTVKYGPMEEGFYNYLLTMKDWYEKGYIYSDFASRTNDLFYLPNTALTYGGAAGVWFGLNSQLGDAMSIPDYGLFFDVKPLTSPLDTANGITEAPSFGINHREDQTGGVAITAECSNIPKLLSVLDSMYGEEGSMMKRYGITPEQGSSEDRIYIAAGLQDGLYTFENGVFEYVDAVRAGDGLINLEPFIDVRLPGFAELRFANENASKLDALGNEVWRRYLGGGVSKLPNALFRPSDEDRIYADNNVRLTDYVDSSVSKFIMGTVELNETTWAQFVDQLIAYGAEENVRILQDSYDRYLGR